MVPLVGRWSGALSREVEWCPQYGICGICTLLTSNPVKISKHSIDICKVFISHE